MKSDRRSFLKKSAVSLAGMGAFTMIPSTVWGAGVAPSDKINVALIGCKSMGFGILKHHLSNSDVNCTAMCDVDEKEPLKSRVHSIKSPYCIRISAKCWNRKILMR
jgi:hypothetical protein